MIKQINSANSAVKRPMRVSDLNDLWNALNCTSGLLAGATPVIISGFNDKGDGYLSAGVIAKSGYLYYHPDVATSRIAIGATAYGHKTSGVDERVFEDSTTQDYSYDMVVNTISSGGASFGVLSLQRVAQLKIYNGKKEVTGTLNFVLTGDPGGHILSGIAFTPDDDIGTGVVITGEISVSGTSTLVTFDVVDADLVKMKQPFTMVPTNSSDMLSMLATCPPIIICSAPPNVATSNHIILRWLTSALPSSTIPYTWEYRVRLFFDV